MQINTDAVDTEYESAFYPLGSVQMSENQNNEMGVAVPGLQSGWHTQALSTPPIININILIEKKCFIPLDLFGPAALLLFLQLSHWPYVMHVQSLVLVKFSHAQLKHDLLQRG